MRLDEREDPVVRTQPAPRRIDSRSVRLLLSLGVVVIVVVPGTFAYFTDTVPVTGTTITAAKVDLKVNGSDSLATYSGLTFTALVPGGSTAAVLTVVNAGTVPLAYYVDASASNTDGKGLAAALTVKVTGNSSTSGTLPTRTCPAAALSGTASSFTTGFVGSDAAPRTLAAGATQTLCVEAGLSSSAPTTLQTATTNVGFVFRAATIPGTTWDDTVSLAGTTLTTATITTPTLNCGATNATQVSVNWADLPGATSYRVFSGSGGSTVEDIPSTTTSYPFKAPASGSTWIQAIYGNPSWISGVSNTRTYVATGDAGTTTCT